MHAARRPAVRAPAVLVALITTATAAVGATQPASGERGVLAAADAGARVLVGRTEEPRKIDVHGYVADLRVEQVLAGQAQVGGTQRIAWEELSRSRPVRFAKGGRVLVCLEPLGGTSIWRKRFPSPGERGDVLTVAANGDAFVREPSPAVLYALGHYLSMAPEARAQSPGLAYVVDLALRADEDLALESVAKLAAREDLARRLSEASQRKLVAGAGEATRSLAVRLAILSLAGRRGLAAARAELASLAEAGPPTDAPAAMALGTIDGGLAPQRADALLASSDPPMRVVGVRFLPGGEEGRVRLAAMVENDPAPAVRVAAVERLLDEYGETALDDVIPALADPDDRARGAAAAKIGALGTPAVAALVEIVGSDDADEGDARRAREGAILALSFAGRDGRRALERIARDHRDERTRKLAALALGRFPGHEHSD